MAQTQTLYIGTYTGPKSQAIYRCTLDEATGQLSEPELVVPIKNPSYLALGPNGKTLYAVCEDGGSAVGAWSIGDNGKLAPLGTRLTGDAEAVHLSVDATGKCLLVANYGGGSLAVFPLDVDGSIGERSALIQSLGSGPNRQRQDKPHAHSIYVDPSNKFSYSCDLGTDRINIYKLKPENGSLEAAPSSFASVPPGAGPRHLAFGPRNMVYVCNEMGVSLSSFRQDPKSGQLTPVATVAILPAAVPKSGVTSAEIFVHPKGHTLYISIRGRNTIAIFKINQDDTLTFSDEVSVAEEPRGFGLSIDGKWLVSAGQRSDQLQTFKVDSHSGEMTTIGRNVSVGTPICILFAPKN